MNTRAFALRLIVGLGSITVGFLAADPTANAGKFVIQSDSLVVVSDGAGNFSIAADALGAAPMVSGKLAEGGAASVRPVQDATFGAGQGIEYRCSNGNQHWIVLYHHLPFVLFHSALHNGASHPIVHRSFCPVAFDLDLGKPAEALRVLGTAGLTTTGQQPSSYVFLAVADPDTRRGVVSAWLTHDRGNGVFFSSIEQGRVHVQPQLDYGRLRIGPGQDAQTETFVVGCFADTRLGLEAWADAVAKVYRIHLHPQVAGYCTWYSNPHGGASDETHLVELAEFAARELKPFGLQVVQIDDLWQMGRRRNGPGKNFTTYNPQGPYPHGLAPVAEKIRALGLTPGLWFMPFAGDHLDPFFKNHPDWFVKRADGQSYETSWGGTCLDMTSPGAREHLRQEVRTIRDWGFRYFKMDGLWTGLAAKQVYVNDGYVDDDLGDAVFHNPDKTNIEAMRDGLKLVREVAGPDVFFSGCNLSQNMRSFSGAVGLVDSMRIGPDNGSRWPPNVNGRVVGTLLAGPYHGSLKYFMHGRLWWNDPDPVYVRASMPLNHARLITSWVAISGQFSLSTDWLPGLPAERLDILKRTLPSHGLLPRPVDLFEQPIPRLWLLTDTRRSPRRDVLAVYNWESQETVIDYALAKMGLDPTQHYASFDFWDNAPGPELQGQLQIKVPAQSCRIFSLCPRSNQPRVLSTSRHVTQGIVDLLEEKWDSTRRVLTGKSLLVANDPYELRVLLPSEEAGWQLGDATMAADDAATQVQVVSQTMAPTGLLRVTLRSAVTGPVRWTLRFRSGG